MIQYRSEMGEQKVFMIQGLRKTSRTKYEGFFELRASDQVHGLSYLSAWLRC